MRDNQYMNKLFANYVRAEEFACSTETARDDVRRNLAREDENQYNRKGRRKWSRKSRYY